MIPLDLTESGLAAANFGMLGLGDIVIPGTCQPVQMNFSMLLFHQFSSNSSSLLSGLFVALLCRFDFK